MATKQQEREALEQIRKIVEGLGKDLNSVKAMAEVASLPEDKRLYGDDFGYEN